MMAYPGPGALRLVGATDPDGLPLTVECAGGLITAVERGPGPTGERSTPEGPASVDLRGMTLLPALVEPHAHIDKAYTADIEENPTGDLDGAIAVSLRTFASMTSRDVERRAWRALGAYLAKGCLSVRTHVAINQAIGLRALEGVLAAAIELDDLMDVQVVGHISPPITGVAGTGNRSLLRAAIDMGITLVGGTPYRSADPIAETRACLEEAERAEIGVDLHTDETLDVSSLTVWELACQVAEMGFPFGVTASHCVSLGVQDPAVQREVAELLARAGVAVISLPQTNLYLQARNHGSAKPRGLTGIEALQAAGVPVAAGGDNVQDPFNPMGRADPLEAASLLVTAGHLDTRTAFEAVTSVSRAVLGLPPVALEVGRSADLVAVPGGCLREVIAEGDPRRVVVRRGVILDQGPGAVPRLDHDQEAAHV
ncbi:MAG: amidohydrolase family protein [Acidimicrobiales bacterium]|nr:amidohydrolase family protein [Acidimicrobiales bacterium]